MADPFSGRSKNPRIRLFVGVIVLLGALGLVLYHTRWVLSVFQGPVPITLATLQELKDPDTLSNPWVSFTFNEAIDTGFVMQSTKSGNTTQRSKYLLIQVGNRWLLADVPFAFTGNQVVGYLDRWWSPLSKQVIDQVRGRFPDRDIFPYQLNAEYSYRGQCFAMLGIAAFIFLAGLAIIGFALSDMRKLKRMALDAPGNQPSAGEPLPEDWKS
jgi:hypothetical protein